MPPSRQRRWILRPDAPSIDECCAPSKELSPSGYSQPATSARLCRRASASAFSFTAEACLCINLAAGELAVAAPPSSFFRARRPHQPLGTDVLSSRWGSALVDFCRPSDPRARSAESTEPRSANLAVGAPLECGPDRRRFGRFRGVHRLVTHSGRIGSRDLPWRVRAVPGCYRLVRGRRRFRVRQRSRRVQSSLSRARSDDGSMTTPSATFANTSRRRARGKRMLETSIPLPALFPLEMVARFLELQDRISPIGKDHFIGLCPPRLLTSSPGLRAPFRRSKTLGPQPRRLPRRLRRDFNPRCFSSTKPLAGRSLLPRLSPVCGGIRVRFRDCPNSDTTPFGSLLGRAQ